MSESKTATNKKAADKPAKTKKTAKAPESQNAPDRLELLFTIVNRSKAEYYLDLLASFGINAQLVLAGHGTADEKTLALFGLEDSDKEVLIGVIRSDRIKEALDILEKKFKTIKNGKGIAYTVPMTGVIGALIYGFLSNNPKAVKREEAK